MDEFTEQAKVEAEQVAAEQAAAEQVAAILEAEPGPAVQGHWAGPQRGAAEGGYCPEDATLPPGESPPPPARWDTPCPALPLPELQLCGAALPLEVIVRARIRDSPIVKLEAPHSAPSQHPRICTSLHY